MNIQDYLNDDSVKAERSALDKEYPSISGKIAHRIYRYRDFVIYHIVIPSTKYGEVSYDVVIEVKTLALHQGDANIERLPMRLFSNCPSFAYGHAYRLARSNDIIDWLVNKLSPAATREAPTRPPKSYLERSTYMALKYLHEKSLSDIPVFKTTGRQVFSTDEIYAVIRTQDEIMHNVQDRIDERRTVRDIEKEKKAREEREKKFAKARARNAGSSTQSKKVQNTKQVKTSRLTSIIGKINFIKHIKKV